jgi:transcriptional regulator with PAS, ATPase and Fis domain
MEDQKVLGLITIAEVMRDAFGEQLEEIFGNRVKIKKYILSDDNIDLSDCDVVLSSSKVIYGRVRDITPENTEVITVRRAINLENISELFQIRPKTKVLVVSNYQYTAKETIDLLKELGIDHLDYSPYSPGDKYSDEKVAITPGGKFLAPDGMEKIIDIGVKLIDVSTIIEILFTLKLSLQNSNFLIANYTKKLVNLNKYSTQLNMVLEGILATSHDGIIAVDEDNEIMFMNKTAEKLMNVSIKNSIGKKIMEVINNNSILNMLKEDKKIFNELISHGNKSLLINKEETIQYSIYKVKVLSIKDITQIQRQEHEIRKKMRSKGFVSKYNFKDIIGISNKLKRTVRIAKKTADNDFTVLIKGESGTGKELFAQAIHNKSQRKNNPFVATNFAALSDSLIESELFGYEEGAFTGAKRGGKAGLFEQAHTGTIFIDEIGDASLTLQARLLRVLQEKEIMRVGGNSIIPVDVRVIAATNKDLQSLVDKGQFRKDLYYRLKVLYFTVPPLRERPEDIYFLVNYFLNNKNDSKVISDRVYKIFKDHNWPGNVRELENIINYISSVVEEPKVEPRHLPEEFQKIDKDKKEENNNESNRINKKLKEEGNLQEFIGILNVLYEAQKQGINIGRKRIADKLKERQLRLTPEMVRGRLKILEKYKLIEIGTTRQGSSLTEQGKELIKLN